MLRRGLFIARGRCIFSHSNVNRFQCPQIIRAGAEIQTTLASIKDLSNIEQGIREVDRVKEGILTEAATGDLLLMGVSKEGFMGKSTVEDLPSEVVYVSSTPTILVKQCEGVRAFWLRRTWEIITAPLRLTQPS